MRSASSILCFGIVFIGACTLPPPAAGVRSSAITAGDVDPGDEAVVALIHQERVICTGTLISPSVVLTAGHCVESPLDAVSFGIDLHDDFRVAIRQAVAHPGFDPGTLADDVALVELETPAATPPIRLPTRPLDPSFVGATLRLVGFGQPSADIEEGVRRQGSSRIEILDDATFSYGPNPSQTCRGDSGGPAFATIDGVEVQVGVTSEGDFGCASWARDRRVDAYEQSFIRPFVDAVDGNRAGGCDVAPAATPSSFGWLLWLAAPLCRRRMWTRRVASTDPVAMRAQFHRGKGLA